jgi:type III secretion protein C
MKIRSRCAALVAMAIFLQSCVMESSKAAPVPWPEVTFTFISDNKDLSYVLNSFCRTFGLQLKATQAVRDWSVVVNGKMTTVSPSEFLNQLSATYGLQWFYFGGTLHVSRNFETATRTISPEGASLASLRKALTELGIVENKFGWGEMPDRGVAMVSGPPSYVELVAWAVSSLPMPQPEQQVKVFRLKHAQVDDRVISYRDQQITTAGVATILRNLSSGDSSRSGTNIQFAALSTPIQGLTNASDHSDGKNAESGNKKDQNPSQEGSKNVSNPSSDGRQRPVIQADSRLNALIIKDVPSRMAVYEELIKVLDVPSKLIEIEAVIVDVNSSRISDLGIDWGGRNGNVAGGFGTPDKKVDSMTGTIVLGNNVNPMTVIPDAGSFLMARLRILESNGDAKIVSRPSILTLDNLGALIDLSETFYVQAIGERVANVVPVSVGTTLKVTPHIVDTAGKQSVRLVVDIEDGAIQDRQIQSLPTIRRSTIGTQAVMNENESLLIGGFNSEQEIKQVDRVPGLGDLPIIGIFFKKKSTNRSKRERLFLITPKIISASPEPHSN